MYNIIIETEQTIGKAIYYIYMYIYLYQLSIIICQCLFPLLSYTQTDTHIRTLSTVH